jgi:hypothetical protein
MWVCEEKPVEEWGPEERAEWQRWLDESETRQLKKELEDVRTSRAFIVWIMGMIILFLLALLSGWTPDPPWVAY